MRAERRRQRLQLEESVRIRHALAIARRQRVVDGRDFFTGRPGGRDATFGFFELRVDGGKITLPLLSRSPRLPSILLFLLVKRVDHAPVAFADRLAANLSEARE